MLPRAILFVNVRRGGGGANKEQATTQQQLSIRLFSLKSFQQNALHKVTKVLADVASIPWPLEL